MTAAGQSVLLTTPEADHAVRWESELSKATRHPPPEQPALAVASGNKPFKRLTPSDGVAMMLVLEVIDGPCEGARFEIGAEGCVLMRNPSGVSATHHRNLGQVGHAAMHTHLPSCTPIFHQSPRDPRPPQHSFPLPA
jgi:hypothetical protein